MMNTMRFPVGLAICVILCASVHASDLDSALSKLENWKVEHTGGPLLGFMETIRSEALAGDREVFTRLSNVARVHDVPLNVSAAALTLACKDLYNRVGSS